MVRRGPLVGLISQFVLLAALSAAFRLGLVGWLAGSGYGLALCGLLSRGMRRSDRRFLGPADVVTLTRAVLVGGVLALTAASFGRQVPTAVMITLAGVALALDAVDGKVARRTATASAFGARFDMEIDAFMILTLSVFVAPTYGAWVLTIGAMRYAFVVASWLLPWLRSPLPPRYWRKAVAAAQGIALALAGSRLIPHVIGIAVLVAALALLVESFGRDVLWSWQSRTSLHRVEPLRLYRVRAARDVAAPHDRDVHLSSAQQAGHGDARSHPGDQTLVRRAAGAGTR